jgi:transporter family-2 protein
MTSTIQILIPVLVGLAVSVQAQFMGQITRAAGTLESTFVTYGTGGLVITLIMILRGGGHIGQLSGLPWHVYLAGVLGLCIVGGISSSVARIGVVATFTTIVAAQLAAGALIDHYGLFDATVRTLNVSRVAGIAMLLAGVWLIVR